MFAGGGGHVLHLPSLDPPLQIYLNILTVNVSTVPIWLAQAKHGWHGMVSP